MSLIREATEQDAAQIMDIYNDAILHSTAVWHEEPVTMDNRIAWLAQKQAVGHPVIVYEQEGQAVGFATYGFFRPFAGYRYTVEHSVYVAKDAQGKGIGSLLLAEIVRLASVNGCKTMVAVIDGGNAASILLHEKLGFHRAGILQNAGYKFGRWLDAVLLQLELPGPEANRG